MFKIPLPELKGKIVLSKKISPSELDARIKEKINELSGLISEEGAAHIIANELGIELTKSAGKLKILDAQITITICLDSGTRQKVKNLKDL